MKTTGLLSTFFFLSLLSYSQLSGTYTVGTGGNYETLSGDGGLFAAINVAGLSGNVTANIISDITENGSHTLNQWTESGGTGYTLTIQPDGTTLRTITSTTFTPIYIYGADRVTIDGGVGKYLKIRCTNTGQQTIVITNGSTSIAITNCMIESYLQSFGTYPIKGNIHLYANAGDNGVSVSNCDICNAGVDGQMGCGIYAKAYSTAGCTNTLTISNNNIYNFSSSTASKNACGVYITDYYDNNKTISSTISGNSFYNNFGTPSISSQTAIYISGGVNHTVTGNYIGGQSAQCGGGAWTNNTEWSSFFGIDIQYGPSATVYDVSNNTIQNLNLHSYFIGYHNKQASVTFQGNTIGHPTSPANIIISGNFETNPIWLDVNDGSDIFNTINGNTIANIQTAGSGPGIRLSPSNMNILNNKIYNISPASGTSNWTNIYGILLYSDFSDDPSTCNIINNVIALGNAFTTNAQFECIDIYAQGSIVNIYYNSLSITGASSGSYSYVFYNGSNSNPKPVNFLNNIICCNRTGAKVYTIFTCQTTEFTSDYNLLYTTPTVFSAWAAYDDPTFSDWKTASGQDAHSWNEEALYTSASGNTPDLSLQVSNNAGTYLASYLTDINGTTRSVTTPDAGAYENTSDEYITFNGSADNTWETAANWTPAWVTSGLYGVDVPAGKTVTINATGKAVRNLDINNGGTLTINPTYDLTSNGTTTLGGAGCLVIESTSEGTASFIVNGTITGSGTATVKRFLTANAWHQITPSTTNVTANDFYWGDAPKSWLTYHTEATNEWTYNTNLTTPMPVGQVWDIWLDNNTKQNATASMTGSLRATDLPVTLGYTDASQGWNFLGNPFPSAIDKDLGTWGENSTGSVYVWDGSDYLYYNTVGGGTLTDGIIPVGQGFFVKATIAGSFTIPAAARIHDSQEFYKNSNGDTKPFIRLDLVTGTNTSVAFIGFPEGGSADFDNNMDADRLFGSLETPQMIIPEGERDLCMNASSPLGENETRVIPLHIMYFQDGTYDLAVSDLDHLPGVQITLEDLHTGELHDLSRINFYHFSANAGDNPDRFRLHFRSNAYGVDDPGSSASTLIKIYSYDQMIYIESQGAAVNKEGVFQLYDLTGRLLMEKHIDKGALYRVPVDFSGKYLIARIIKENEEKTTKIYIK